MSRYPSSDVARFDQQFAETEGERNERLRRKRLAASSDALFPDEYRVQIGWGTDDNGNTVPIYERDDP